MMMKVKVVTRELWPFCNLTPPPTLNFFYIYTTDFQGRKNMVLLIVVPSFKLFRAEKMCVLYTPKRGISKFIKS